MSSSADPPNPREADLARRAAVAAQEFRVYGDFLSATPFGNGHINDSFAATFSQGGAPVRFLLQRINERVFRDPPALMENVVSVTTHLHDQLVASGARETSRRALTLVPSRAGLAAWRDAEGSYWRAYVFIEGTRSVDVVESPAQASEAATAFASFQSALAGLPGRLVETIPDFHHTPKRFAAFEAALAADACGRAAGARAEVSFALERGRDVGLLVDLLARGELPERVTHNDTKVNNVLLDTVTGEGVCVTDLDTVMPGLVLYDFGDLVRTAANTGAEDEPDLDRVRLSRPMFTAIAAGYLRAAGGFLTRAEREHLVFSAWLMTIEVGLRFLADHLEGDSYFKTHRPNHNLERARAQFRLAQWIEIERADLERAVARM